MPWQGYIRDTTAVDTGHYEGSWKRILHLLHLLILMTLTMISFTQKVINNIPQIYFITHWHSEQRFFPQIPRDLYFSHSLILKISEDEYSIKFLREKCHKHDVQLPITMGQNEDKWTTICCCLGSKTINNDSNEW